MTLLQWLITMTCNKFVISNSYEGEFEGFMFVWQKNPRIAFYVALSCLRIPKCPQSVDLKRISYYGVDNISIAVCFEDDDMKSRYIGYTRIESTYVVGKIH